MVFPTPLHVVAKPGVRGHSVRTLDDQIGSEQQSQTLLTHMSYEGFPDRNMPFRAALKSLASRIGNSYRPPGATLAPDYAPAVVPEEVLGPRRWRNRRSG